MLTSARAAPARSAAVRARLWARMRSRSAALTAVASDRICGKPVTMPVPFGTIPPDAASSVDDRSLLEAQEKRQSAIRTRPAAGVSVGGAPNHRATIRCPEGRDKRYGFVVIHFVGRAPSMRVSLRARLALVLAVVVVGPVVAAGLVVAVLVPRARAEADAATLRQSLRATS